MDLGKDDPGSTFSAPDPKIYLPFRPPAGDPPDNPIDKRPKKYGGPFFPIPPVKCSGAPDPDGPGQVNVLYSGAPDPDGPGQVNVLYARAPDPDGPGQVNVQCGPFRPINPVRCPTGGGPIGDPNTPWWPGGPVRVKRKVTPPKRPVIGPCFPKPPKPTGGKRYLITMFFGFLCCKINQMTQLTRNENFLLKVNILKQIIA